MSSIPQAIEKRKFHFHPFYHPFVEDFARQLRLNGIDGLLQRPMQVAPYKFKPSGRPFDFATYNPGSIVAKPYPNEEVDFSYGGAYSLYNWELFFHAPLLIADRLSKNQKFEEAARWFHYIFNPTDASGGPAPQKYWQTKRFFEISKPEYLREQILHLLQLLAEGRPDPELQQQVAQWRQNPFKPHLIARLRPVAYQKNVVMKYIDNLVAWADSLFRQDTIESVNEAAQLYVLASEILGRRPETMKPRALPKVQTYNDLEASGLDNFSNALVALESYVPPIHKIFKTSAGSAEMVVVDAKVHSQPIPRLLYFCVPKNDKLLSYWDLVADRLFKIRHCMNIEGRVRQLPLFDPPIDPALLVRAAAAGVDLSEALSEASAPLPPYRFQAVSQKASELCSDVKALGGALLSVLEKRDAEALSLLRSSDELKVLAAVRQVKEKQVEESKAALQGLEKGKEMTTLRRDYYRDIVFMNPAEQAQQEQMQTAVVVGTAKVLIDNLRAIFSLIPEMKVGAPTSMGVTLGGSNLGWALAAASMASEGMVSVSNTGAALSGVKGGHERLRDEWKLQEKMADKEMEQLDKQIATAQIRVAIAEKDLSNHDLQTNNAKEYDDFMRDKFTNRELYDWMVGQISTVFFQSYRLAYDVARRAERSYRFELGLEASNFIQFGYWDSLKKGLLAGEKLHHDLKRMEADHLDRNRRERELVKNVSLSLTDPAALVKLKQTGECFFRLSEALFDMDHPGHYFRRIKSVALSVPCVAGPYQGVHATLTLTGSRLRKNALLSNGKYERVAADDGVNGRFRDDFLPMTDAIATSTGREDAGLFEANLRDERYLPFEGAGADSDWRLVLDKDANRFDFGGISDVILHIRYTARDGSDALRIPAKARLKTLQKNAATTTLLYLFSLKSGYSDGWHRFLHPADTDLSQSLAVDFTNRLPTGTKISSLEFFFKVRDGSFPASPAVPANIPLELYGNFGGTGVNLLLDLPLESDPALDKMHHRSVVFTAANAPATYLLRIAGSSIPPFLAKTATVSGVHYKHMDPEKVEDIFLLLRLVQV